MAAAFVLKMAAAVCVAMLVVQSAVGYEQLPVGPTKEQAGGGGPLACPSAQNVCRTTCRNGCDTLSVAMCQIVCLVSPLPALDSACVNNVLSVCQAACKTTCETLTSV